jgi:hypothetical protein
MAYEVQKAYLLSFERRRMAFATRMRQVIKKEEEEEDNDRMERL